MNSESEGNIDLSIEKERQIMPMIEVYFQAFKAIAELLGTSVKATIEAGQSGDLVRISEEAQRQEFEMKMAAAQARVTQELAIANRIENAEEVEIEEFYDTTGKGSAGLNLDDGSLTLGASGSGRRIVRRVYRFKRISFNKEEGEVMESPSDLVK